MWRPITVHFLNCDALPRVKDDDLRDFFAKYIDFNYKLNVHYLE